jgi:hypothetical protein
VPENDTLWATWPHLAVVSRISETNTKCNIRMKTVMKLVRILAIALSLGTVSVFAEFFLETASVGVSGDDYNDGVIYNVPAGANYEWEVYSSEYAYAHLMIGGGGLDVNTLENSIGAGQTSYSDNINYQMHASSNGGNAYTTLYVGW